MSGKAVTLNEMMGRKGSGGAEKKLGFDDLKDLLGEGMQKMEFNRVGRVRLMNALRQRFGQGFRNLPGVSDIIKDFDEKSTFEKTISRMKRIRVIKNG